MEACERPQRLQRQHPEGRSPPLLAQQRHKQELELRGLGCHLLQARVRLVMQRAMREGARQMQQLLEGASV
ncbi:hypothetical protein [Mumia zhuanghuii]|uniref:Uncharacterized protein n=1 Tax=Mumia zhuanghuii TaxID=2585211 RepID=A0A5C4M9K0_9ACTN|nr:hypothetical protein [Mumia zhuanghuii]TNC31313.1 hypothetical protein FHE65_32100 [Mumia zhuanghuii]